MLSDDCDMHEEAAEKKTIRHPIRFKIFLVSLVPTLALLAAALLNNQYLNALGDSAEKILSKNYKSIRAAQESRQALEEIRNLVLEKLPQIEASEILPENELSDLFDNLNICRENVTEVGEQELIDRLYNTLDSYRPLVRSLTKEKSELWSSKVFSDFIDETAGMVALIDDLVAVNEKAMERAEEQTRLLARRAQRNAGLLFGVIITAILTLSYFLSYWIAKPVMNLARQILNIQEGSGVYPKIDAESGDEIGFLTRSFNRLFNRLEQYDHHRDEIISAEREKVRSSEEAKGRFIADISHQLKTPMTSLAMSIGMLHSRSDALESEKRVKLIATANDDCIRLTTLINELVDISRLETMSQPRPKEILDISIVVQECLAQLVKQAESKGIVIDIDVPEKLPRVAIDSFRFPWVITNLIGNALRYTDRGGHIGLKVYRKKARFYFECSDTGSGINPEYLPHIFDRFTQFSERGKSGTIGLGLAIVKDIIEQHGGDIQVRSKLGEGTCFTFWIPDNVEKTSEKSTDHR